MKKILSLLLFISAFAHAQNNCSMNKIDGSYLECNGSNQISLKNTDVSAGSYIFSGITVNAKGQITSASNGDTTSMLLPYLRKVDTTSMLSYYLRKVDTTAMLSPYLRSVTAAATYTPLSRTLTINGTALDLSSDRSWSVGTVTSIGITAGTGISVSGSPVTSSGSVTVTNSSPDQTVVLTEGTGIDITGSYPNFTITNSSASTVCSIDSFSFSDATGIGLNTLTTSSGVIISADTTCVWPLMVRGDGSPQVKVNSGSWGTIDHARDGDTIYVRATSSGTGLTTTTVALYTQQYTTRWHITTDDIDSDADAFWTAAGITDVTIQNALNALVKGLKTDGLWTKAYAIYPFVGGTATTHKYNLKDPRDLDAAFRIVFGGTVTHSSTGITGNGTTGYADTKLNVLSVLSQNDFAVGVDYLTNSDGDKESACTDGPSWVEFNVKSGGASYNRINGSSIGFSNSDSRGFYIMTRTSSTNAVSYKDAVSKATSGSTSTALPNRTFWYGAQNNGGSGAYFDNRNIDFGWISQSLNSTENTDLYNRLQTFKTALGR